MRSKHAAGLAVVAGALAGLVLAVQSACLQSPGNGYVFNPRHLDFAYYVCVVDPILQQSCSYPLCHGQEGQPLRIYSLGKLRLGALDNWQRSNSPLSRAELNANYNGAVSFFQGFGSDPQDSLLLREPLPTGEGGPAHYGGAVWTGTDDPRYQRIFAWAKGANFESISPTAPQSEGPAGSQAACKAVLTAYGVSVP